MWMLIVGTVILIAGLIYTAKSKQGDFLSMYIGIIGMAFCMAATSDKVGDTAYKDGQIDALKGNYKYEQTIKYEQVDTGYVPVDTVYVKIKSKE